MSWGACSPPYFAEEHALPDSLSDRTEGNTQSSSCEAKAKSKIRGQLNSYPLAISVSCRTAWYRCSALSS